MLNGHLLLLIWLIESAAFSPLEVIAAFRRRDRGLWTRIAEWFRTLFATLCIVIMVVIATFIVMALVFPPEGTADQNNGTTTHHESELAGE